MTGPSHLPLAALLCAAAAALSQPAEAFVTTLAPPHFQTFGGFTESLCSGAIEREERAPFEFTSTNPLVVLSENAASEENVVDCDPTQPFVCTARTVTDHASLRFTFDYTGQAGFLRSALFESTVGGGGDPTFPPEAASVRLVVGEAGALPVPVDLLPVGPTGGGGFAYQGEFDPPLFVDGPRTFDLEIAGHVPATLELATTPSSCPGDVPPVVTGAGFTQLFFQAPVLTLAGDEPMEGGPVAQIALGEEPHSCGQPVTLDGSGSSHTDPERSIVLYEWDLDEDGSFDDAAGATIQPVFDAFGTRVVAVRVTDDGIPPRQDVAGAVVTAENRAPVADAGGPYEIDPQDTLLLDGSASFDPNELCGDTVTDFEWDLDDDGTPDASGPAAAFSPEGRAALGLDEGEYAPRLKAADCCGRNDDDLATLWIGSPPHAPNLTVRKTVLSSSFRAGDLAVYLVTVRNRGGVAAAGPITVTDVLSAGLTYVRGVGDLWSCPEAPAGPTVTCTHPGPVEPGLLGEISFALTARIAEDAPDTVTNMVRVAATGDADPSNDEAQVTRPVVFRPDLAIAKTALGPFVSGRPAAYAITVTNVGRVAFQGGATVVDELPAGVVYAGSTGPPFTCVQATAFVVVCDASFLLEPLVPNASVTIRLDVNVTGEPRTALNRAVLQVNDGNAANNGPADAPAEVLPAPDDEEEDEEAPECDVDVEGWLAPGQGVWQDDDHFEDKPTKQLTRVTPRLYEAELDLVKDRPTLLHGIRDADGEARRDRIVIRGTGSGSPTPVRMRFVLEQGGRREVLFLGPPAEAPIDGPCGAPRPFEVAVDARDGIPPLGARAFTFRETGPYRLFAELAREDGVPTGLRVAVVGEVVDPGTLRVELVPATFLGLTPEGVGQLQQSAADLADASQRRLPDYMPVAPGRVAVATGGVRDFGRIVERAQGLLPFFGSVDPSDVIRDEVTRWLQAGAFLAGTQRIAVLLPDADYAAIDPIADDGGSVGLAVSEKVTFLRDGRGARGMTDTLAHEIVHTLPFAWSGPPHGEDPDPDRPSTMFQDCGDDWHNLTNPVAHGHAITEDSIEWRRRIAANDPIMGFGPGETWIAQCTYWHALGELLEGPDPELWLVQGRILRDPDAPFGELLPFYETLGTRFREDADDGDWALRLRAPDGALLGRFPIRPVFDVPDGAARDLASFAFQIPRTAGTSLVELVGPGGALLDTLTVSEHAPEVAIDQPVDGALLPAGDGTALVRFTTADPDGDPLVATVLYSRDDGVTWELVSFEEEAAEALVPLAARAAGHRVRVVTSDGARSGEAEVGFSLDLAPSADLALAMGGDPEVVLPGGVVRYLLEARNAGPTDASAVALTGVLPEGAAFEAATAGCEAFEGVVTCALGDLPAGAVARREIRVRVGGEAVASLDHEAQVSGAEPDPDGANDVARVVTPLPDLGRCGGAARARVHPKAQVAADARLCDDARVGAFARVEGGAVVGEKATLSSSARLEAGAALARGASAGPHARIGGGALLDVAAAAGPRSTVGAGSVVGRGARLLPGSSIGEEARVGSDARVGARADAGRGVRIGDEVRIAGGARLGDGSTLGPRARVGPRATLGSEATLEADATLRARARVGDRARVGSGSVVGRGATIGADAVLGRDVFVASGAEVPPGALLPDGTSFP